MYERLTGQNDPRFVEEEMTDTEFELYERLDLIETRLEHANNVLDVQGQDGNWNANLYMLGMYNGIEAVIACIENRPPNYRSIKGSPPRQTIIDLSDEKIDHRHNRRDGNYYGEFDGPMHHIPDGDEPYSPLYDRAEGSIDNDFESDDEDIDAGDIDVDPRFFDTSEEDND